MKVPGSPGQCCKGSEPEQPRGWQAFLRQHLTRSPSQHPTINFTIPESSSTTASTHHPQHCFTPQVEMSCRQSAHHANWSAAPGVAADAAPSVLCHLLPFLCLGWDGCRSCYALAMPVVSLEPLPLPVQADLRWPVIPPSASSVGKTPGRSQHAPFPWLESTHCPSHTNSSRSLHDGSRVMNPG